jgi:hypothetical protein
MDPRSIFLMRMGLGVLFAFLVVKIFYPEGGYLTVAAFAVFFVGLAYLLTYLRTRREKADRTR